MFSDPILGCYGTGRFVDWLSSKFATKNELNADSGVTAGSYGPTANATPEAGGSIVVPQVTVDKRGRITGATDRTIMLPAGGGGGGGRNEPYVQVYSQQITSATSAGMIITDEDLGGVYQDIVIYLYTLTVPSVYFGDDPAYGMQLQFLASRTFSSPQDVVMTLGYSSITRDLNTPHMFVFRFLNDGGLLFGTQGQSLASSQALPSTECVGFWPFIVDLAGEGGPQGIRFVYSLPTNSRLVIYARNKIASNDNGGSGN